MSGERVYLASGNEEGEAQTLAGEASASSGQVPVANGTGGHVWEATSGVGDLLKANNLSDVADAGSSRANLHVPMLTPVLAVATANVVTLSGLQAIDGATPGAGAEELKTVLLTAQAEAKNNGLWNQAAGAWTRPTEFAEGLAVKARVVDVVAGTLHEGSEWYLKATETVTVGTTAQTWKERQPASVVSSGTKALGEVTGNITPNLSEGRVFTMTEGAGSLTIKKPTNWPSSAQATYGELVVSKNEHGLTVEVSGWLGAKPTFETGAEALNVIWFVSWDGGVHWYGAGTEEALILALAIPVAQKGKASGVAELNAETRLPEAQLPLAVALGLAEPTVAPGFVNAINVKDKKYGAKGNGRIILDASMENGKFWLKSKTAKFTSADKGKHIGISGASVAFGEVLRGEIVTVNSAEEVLLSVECTKTVIETEACYGTDDTEALRKAYEAAPSYTYSGSVIEMGPGATVYAPAGIYVCTAEVRTKNRVRLLGDGPGRTIFAPMSGKEFLRVPAEESTFAKPNLDLGFEQFTIEASWMYAASGVYESNLKVLNIYQCKRARCLNVTINNCPATAFPFDESNEQLVLENCLAYRAGRLCGGKGKEGEAGCEGGGSGFGMGCNDTSNAEPTTVTNCWAIECKRYGFFNEGESAGTENTASYGYRYTNNYASGCKIGFASSGSKATLFSNNTAVKCTEAGFSLDGGTVTSSFLPGQVRVSNNVIIECGNGIQLEGVNGKEKWLDFIENNLILTSTKHGIAVIANATNVRGLKISGNTISTSKLSGIRFYLEGATKTAELVDCVVADNLVYNNGQEKTASNKQGIRCELVCVGCTFESNKCFDNQGTKTQERGMSFQTTFTGGVVRNNDLRENETEGSMFPVTAASETTVISGNTGCTTPAFHVVTVSTGVFTFTAPAPCTVFLYEGTVTKIELNAATKIGVIDGQYPLEQGDKLEITNTVVPILKWRPR